MIKLLKELFIKKIRTAIELHAAGATVQHFGSFKDIPTFSTGKELSQNFVDKWVIPFYMRNIINNDEYKNNFLKIKDDINIFIVKDLLGDFNWRTRITGAYFSAIMNYHECEQIIGNHLLKSEVCFAGHGYCICLASFNTNSSIKYLQKYLDYYLLKTDLWFNQNSAMAAIAYLDKENNTNILSKYMNNWESFVINKPNWDLSRSIASFEQEMEALNNIL
ncbi:hypothetical protein BGP_2989 [Beggiatoa sp. PS]|nr:hypothetical protein BGP_2989 [Beggiatoa sp. PS]